MKSSLILVADDDENDVMLLRRAFSRAAISNPLEVVTDGAAALAYLQGEGIYNDRLQYPLPCLLLLDIKMPKKTGFEVLSWIRQDSNLKRMLVVMMSASTQMGDINQSYDLGANSYLVKPHDFQTLVELAKTLQHYWISLNQSPEIQPEVIVA